jgi:hypothetical protein
VDAILAILNIQLIPSLISIAENITNGLFISEPSVVKHLLVLNFFVEHFFSIPHCDPLLSLFVFHHQRIPWPHR